MIGIGEITSTLNRVVKSLLFSTQELGREWSLSLSQNTPQHTSTEAAGRLNEDKYMKRARL